MIARDTLIGGVLAATDKLVRQAEQGDWASVAKTAQQRRAILEALANHAAPAGEHDFLKALRAAVAESDRALGVMGGGAQDPSARQDGLCTKA